MKCNLLENLLAETARAEAAETTIINALNIIKAQNIDVHTKLHLVNQFLKAYFVNSIEIQK